LKREDTRAAYYEFSGKLSDIVRQLNFAGIAVIWVFKQDRKPLPTVPAELTIPALLFVLSLALDVLQYSYQTAAWGIFNRRLEVKGVSEDTVFTAPTSINRVALICFWLKTASLAGGYIYLIVFLARRIAA